MEPRLKSIYREEVLPSLMERFSYENTMEAPRVEKIVLNMGLGRLSDGGRDDKVIDEAAQELSRIAGQKAVVTKSKKSIAGFKLREDMPVGCKVTLRGARMYEFFDRLVNLALPRVRDFRGVSPKAFDGSGNYTMGIKEHIIFPEIDHTKIENSKGMNITIVTTAETDEEARELLGKMGMPFSKS